MCLVADMNVASLQRRGGRTVSICKAKVPSQPLPDGATLVAPTVEPGSPNVGPRLHVEVDAFSPHTSSEAIYLLLIVGRMHYEGSLRRS
jgi:hypothetical protein